jgi:hypothetical protein
MVIYVEVWARTNGDGSASKHNLEEYVSSRMICENLSNDVCN